jgi:hypothetical protein
MNQYKNSIENEKRYIAFLDDINKKSEENKIFYESKINEEMEFQQLLQIKISETNEMKQILYIDNEFLKKQKRIKQNEFKQILEEVTIEKEKMYYLNYEEILKNLRALKEIDEEIKKYVKLSDKNYSFVFNVILETLKNELNSCCYNINKCKYLRQETYFFTKINEYLFIDYNFKKNLFSKQNQEESLNENEDYQYINDLLNKKISLQIKTETLKKEIDKMLKDLFAIYNVYY